MVYVRRASRRPGGDRPGAAVRGQRHVHAVRRHELDGEQARLAGRDEVGLGHGPYVGPGLTTMTLDFDTSQAVELGVAPTFGVLDNHVLVGAGASLQASTNRWFGFFAIRLFGVYGGIGTAAPR